MLIRLFPLDQRTFVIGTLVLALIIQCTLMTTAAADKAGDRDSLQLARSYFQYLDEQKFAEARSLMADEIVFEDPTWGGAPVIGAEKVIELYSNSAGFENQLLNERLAFVSRNTAVIHYVASVDLVPPDALPDDKPIPAMADLVRMVTVKDGKVVRHIDLASYASLQEALARAKGSTATE